MVLINSFFSGFLYHARQQEVSYNEFQSALKEKKIDEVQVENETITYTLKNDENKRQYYTGNMQDPSLTSQLIEAKARFNRIYPQEINPLFSALLTFLLPLLLLWGLGNSGV